MNDQFMVQDLFVQCGAVLGLTLLTGHGGLNRKIHKAEVQRPGLSLTGYLKNIITGRIYIFGKVEIEYLNEQPQQVRLERLQALLKQDTPCVIVANKHQPPSELISVCASEEIPLFQAKQPSMELMNRMTILLADRFLPMTSEHGTLVEVFGIGVLIQGESSVGKSEVALGLIERGHRLISDDLVLVKKTKEGHLVGSGPELTRHMMEIRGIGIINVAQIYGAVCVRADKSIDIVVRLEPWEEGRFYDRVGIDETFVEILNVRLFHHILPVKPGRDVALLIETIATNHRLKEELGLHPAKEFRVKLLQEISKQQIDSANASL